MSIDLRKPTPEDLERFKECLSADTDHQGQSADEWASAPGELWTLFDGRGNRVFMRIERVLRVSIQHDPNVTEVSTGRLLYNGFRWIMGTARVSGFTEIIFESRAKRLIHFIEKLFGAKPVEENYSVRT